jgi:hypothetical protein
MGEAARTALKVGAPIVAVATLMLGLRIGAKDAVRAAVVFGAPPGRTAPGEKTRLAWQVVTFLDDRGVRETIAVRDLTVIGRAKGEESRWTGSSNVDGVAEPVLSFTSLAAGDPVELEVREAGDPSPLAIGTARWRSDEGAGAGRVPWGGREQGELTAAARPTSREGALGVDVLVESGRVIPGFSSPLWVHVTPPAGGVAIAVTPEPGLRVDEPAVTTCDRGWAEVDVVPEAHVVGATFEAKSATATGKWFGALPVAPGAFFVSVPRVLPAGKEASAVLIAPNPRHVVYAELDDPQGRVAAAALEVGVEPGDPTPRARFAIPPLASGLYWLVVSGEPRGAEHLGGAAIAKPILAGEVDGVDATKACDVGPWLARHPAEGFPRWIALDGLPLRSASNRSKHRLGLFIGLVSLVAAAILEAILVVAADRSARVAMQLAELEEGQEPTKVTARPPGGGLVIALLMAVLGFALLAVLLVAKG